MYKSRAYLGRLPSSSLEACSFSFMTSSDDCFDLRFLRACLMSLSSGLSVDALFRVCSAYLNFFNPSKALDLR